MSPLKLSVCDCNKSILYCIVDMYYQTIYRHSWPVHIATSFHLKSRMSDHPTWRLPSRSPTQTRKNTTLLRNGHANDHWRRQLWGTGARAHPRLPASYFWDHSLYRLWRVMRTVFCPVERFLAIGSADCHWIVALLCSRYRWERVVGYCSCTVMH